MKKSKLLSLVLVCLMVLGLVSVNAAEIKNVPIALTLSEGDMIEITNAYKAATTPSNYRDIGAVGSISQHITLENGGISGIGMTMPSYSNNIGTATVTVYQWNGNYESTLKTKPIAQKDFIDQPDNAFCTVSVGSNNGDILVHLTNGSDRVGVWVTEDPAGAPGVTQTTYENGVATNGCLSLSFAKGTVKEGIGEAQYSAYEYIESGKVDGMSDAVTVANRLDTIDGTTYGVVEWGKLNVGSYHTKNSYVLYKGVDFGTTSPKRLQARVYITPYISDFMGDMQFVLDDVDGKIIASIRPLYDYYTARAEAEKTGNTKGYWQDVVCEVTEEVTGVHNLYVLNRGKSGYTANADPLVLGKFKFTTEEVPVTHWEKELAEFVPVDQSALMDHYADTWVATDDLGRKLPDYNEVGEKRDRGVFMFYWLTKQGQVGSENDRKGNNQNIVDASASEFDVLRKNLSAAGFTREAFWNESIYGYYTQTDTWVMRKNLELLAAAGVDAICTDETNNAWVHTKGAFNMMRTMHKMMQEGIDVPKYVQILRWGNGEYPKLGLENVYNSYFANGLYSDTWYYHDGKPLIMAANDGDITEATGHAGLDASHKEILDFFTFRPCHAAYKTVPQEDNWWPWCSVAPQPGFNYQEDTGKYEMVAVSVAQNSNDDAASYCAMSDDGVYGRSYTYKDRWSKLSEDSVFYGYNYQEQWDNALKMDPENVFITGWNEYIASMDTNYTDQFTDEYSRDVEPVRGQLKDTYYMQTVANIRRYKGVNPTPVATGAKAIDVAGDFNQWENVGPDFHGYKGGTEVRDYVGFGQMYYNDTGRNDIVKSKVSYDAENFYFYTETSADLTPATDKHWMRLYINADRSFATGWEGYDFIVNRVSPADGKVIIEEYVGIDNTWKWAEVARADYKVEGNKLMLNVPRDVLGAENGIDIEFKWHDNGVEDGDVMDFYVNGDAAPVGRFNYRYVEEKLVNTPVVDEPVDPATDLDMLMRKYVVFAINKPEAYVKGFRNQLDDNDATVTPKIINGETFVPFDFLADAWYATVTWDESGNSAQITVGTKSTTVQEGRNLLKTGSKFIELKNAPVRINGTLYVPLRPICDALEFECVWLNPGVIVMGQRAKMKIALDNEFVERLKARFDFN